MSNLRGMARTRHLEPISRDSGRLAGNLLSRGYGDSRTSGQLTTAASDRDGCRSEKEEKDHAESNGASRCNAAGTRISCHRR